MIELDAKTKHEILNQLIRQSGWKIVEELLESQWMGALGDFKKATTIEEFYKAQATINQIEGLFNQIKGHGYVTPSKDKIKKIMDLDDIKKH